MRVVSIGEQEDVTCRFAKEKPDLVVLDLQLGREGGLDPLRVIRSQSNVPLIVTIDRRLDEADRVIALELGADDCITKPLGLRELLARIRAILRRSKARRSESGRSPGPRYCRFGGWQLDRRNRSLTSPDGGAVAITKGECALLLAFLDAPMRTLSREHLLQATRMHEDVFDRSIDVRIWRLRRKLERDPAWPRMIQTQRGIGYVFALPVEAHDGAIRADPCDQFVLADEFAGELNQDDQDVEGTVAQTDRSFALLKDPLQREETKGPKVSTFPIEA